MSRRTGDGHVVMMGGMTIAGIPGSPENPTYGTGGSLVDIQGV